jgi:hypothetical protein
VIVVTLTMYDSVNVGTLPHGADAYAGYVQGAFPTFAALKRLFAASGAHLLSIAVFASGNADCLDIEPGDATIAQAPRWVKRQLARGAHRPCLYTSVSNMDALVDARRSRDPARRGPALVGPLWAGKAHLRPRHLRPDPPCLRRHSVDRHRARPHPGRVHPAQ